MLPVPSLGASAHHSGIQLPEGINRHEMNTRSMRVKYGLYTAPINFCSTYDAGQERIDAELLVIARF